MRNHGVWWVIAGVCLAGCQANDVAPQPAAGAPPAKTVAAPTLPVQTTPIQLVGPSGVVRVGDAVEKAQRVYPAPKNAYKLRELPERFSKPYEAVGWESARGEGFGLISWDGSVVVALYQVERGDEQMLNEILNQQRAGTGDLYPYDILGKSVRFWFWEDKGQRLMVSAAQNTNKFVSITVAMGDQVVLDALGASPDSAKKIQERLDNGIPAQLVQETIGKATNGEPSSTTKR